MIKDHITIHAFTDENGVHLKVNIPEDDNLRGLLKNKITINEECPKLSFVDQLLNGEHKLENSAMTFELGMLGVNHVAVILLNDGNSACSFYVHEGDIQISDFSFMDESENSISIKKETANDVADKPEGYQISELSNNDAVLTVESMNFIFCLEAYQEFLLTTLNISNEDNSVKKCNKLKVKALKLLIEKSLSLDSPLNTKSNKKALGYLSKAPKQIMMIVSDALIEEYNKSSI